MLTSHPLLWNAVLHPQMHAHMPRSCTLVCAHVDDPVVGCQCQRQGENPASLTLALLSQWTKRDLRNSDASYCFFCNFSKCWPLIYQWFGQRLMGVFLFFFGSSLTQVRCCMLTTAPQDMGWWVCSCWPTCGSAMLFWSLWNTIQRSSLSMFPSSPHTHYGKMNTCSLFLIYGQVKSPYHLFPSHQLADKRFYFVLHIMWPNTVV